MRLSAPGDQKAKCRVQVISDPAMWRVAPVEVVSPLEVSQVDFAQNEQCIPQGLALRAGAFSTPFEMSARRGFPNFTVAWLRSLLTFCAVQFPNRSRPQTEMPIVEALVREILGDRVTEDDIAKILALRASRAGSKLLSDTSELAKGDNMELVKDFFDEGDADDAQAMVNKIVEAKAKGASASSGKGATPSAGLARGSTPVVGNESASSKAPASNAEPPRREPTKVRVPEADAYAAADYKEYLPKAVGVSLTLDTLWHNRWVVTYRNKAPPTHHSCSFGARTGRSVHEALMTALRWTWQSHTEATGEECPYTL